MRLVLLWIWNNYKTILVSYLIEEFGEAEDYLQEKWKAEMPCDIKDAVNDIKDAIIKAFSDKK